MNPADLLHLLVADVLTLSPSAAKVFLDRRMGCVGCPFSWFETVADGARNYGVDAVQLAAALLEAGSIDATEGEPS